MVIKPTGRLQIENPVKGATMLQTKPTRSALIVVEDPGLSGNAFYL